MEVSFLLPNVMSHMKLSSVICMSLSLLRCNVQRTTQGSTRSALRETTCPCILSLNIPKQVTTSKVLLSSSSCPASLHSWVRLPTLVKAGRTHSRLPGPQAPFPDHVTVLDRCHQALHTCRWHNEFSRNIPTEGQGPSLQGAILAPEQKYCQGLEHHPPNPDTKAPCA